MTNIEISCEYLSDPRLGIMVYRNALPESLRLVERLEETIGNSTTAPYKWMEALVGHSEKRPDYRDCVDCKISEQLAQNVPAEFAEIRNIWQDTTDRLTPCLNHYEQMYNIKMEYMEAINYIRYGEGQHFQTHTDHGFSYTCTVSSVMYLNDNYEGGELYFPHFQLRFKPEAGDVVFFPSTYIFSHAALEVTKGVKYSAVTMFDYNDKNHKDTGHSYVTQDKAAPQASRGVADAWGEMAE